MGFLGRDPNAEITVPFVPVMLVVRDDGWINPAGFKGAAFADGPG